VKLADRLDRMRFLKNLSEEKQKSVATEVLEIWSPLANRLGMSSLKDELEDLGLKYTNPDAYEQIKRLVQLKKGERSVYLEKAEKEIYKAAAKQNLDIKISSRAKHFYSIYQKMRKRGKAVDEIYDLLALRIICENQAACYSLIGIVHTLWKPMEGRFKDYIAMPKTNGYQSLHTTVMCEGFPLEIQIRTKEMHSVAEHGVASHWLYKKGKSKDSVSVENLSIINQLKALRAENKNDAELFAEIKDELLGDSIYVFTPQGDVRELPAGATAIDFAYSIHSRIGETIVGAKADGNIIPLSSP
jgi:GTP pyrophosphokinase